jgi:N utilization substance protein B
MAMGMRRRGREIALQVLYQLDVQPQLAVDDALARFDASFLAAEAQADDDGESGEAVDDDAHRFAARLVRGVGEHLAAIDARIGRASRNWRLERMARVDRNLLRLAVFELALCDDVPAKVAINEAIEIAKRFGAAETPAFVNGILDRVLEDLNRPV